MRLTATLLALLYPLVVYAFVSGGIQSGIPAILCAIVAVKTFSLCIRFNKGRLFATTTAALATGLVVGICTLRPSSPLLYPVIVNAVLLVVFGSSLIFPPTVIERVARMKHGDLPPHGVTYCRKVCVVWSLFFMFNLAISLDSVTRPIEWWSLYNGCISYIAIGAIFGVEYLIRRRVMSRAALVVALSLGLAGSSYTALADSAAVPSHLQATLKVSAPFRATFTEKRFISVLTAPLESKGEIECLPGTGLIWRVLEPSPSTSVITPTNITIIDSEGERRTIADQANVSAALLSLMSGNIERASKDFSLSTSEKGREWSITLTPRDSLVGEVIQKIVVSGTQQPTIMSVVHANGDRIDTTFSPPTPLSSDDIHRAQATLHEAS